MHRPADPGVGRLLQQLFPAAVGALHLDIHTAVAGEKQIDVMQLQLAGERVNVLVDVLIDIVAVARQARLLVVAGDGFYSVGGAQGEHGGD